MSKAKHFGPPSSLALGSIYAEKLIRVDSAKDPPKLVINRIIGVLEATNLIQLKSVMDSIFKILQDSNATEEQKSTLRLAIKEIISEFQSHPHFRPHMISLFDTIQKFPIGVIQSLPLEDAIILSTYFSFSKHPQIAKAYLTNNLFRSATKETVDRISENTLYEIASLQIDNKFVNERLSEFSCYIPHNDEKERKEVLVDFDEKDRPSLYEAVLETEIQILIKADQLRRLLDFFPSFNAKHAAAFLTSISSSKCCFRNSYFFRLEETQKERIIDLYRESFNQRNVDISKIALSLDQPNTPPLDTEGFNLLFQLLKGLLKDKKIPGKAFLGRWKNRNAQLQYISYIANNKIPNLSFEDDCKMVDLHGYEVTTEIPNNCWLCIDYVETVLDMTDTFLREITQLLSIASDQFSGPLLLAYSQLPNVNEEITYVFEESDSIAINSSSSTDFLNLNHASPINRHYLFRKSSVTFIFSIIQAHHTFQIIKILWQNNNKFCCWLFHQFYKEHPSKLNTIIDAIGDNLNKLLQMHDDLKFVIDLAFQASLRGIVEIGTFIKQLVERTNNPNVLINVLEFVKSMVLDSSMPSPALFSNSLNAMFKYFWDNFSTLSSDTQLLVNTVYSICDSSVPNIKKVPFSDSLPSIKTPEVKESASELFTKFFTDQLSVSQFVQTFHHHRVSSQTLFHSMEHYLLLELKYLDQHEERDVEKLGQLVGNMVHENLFNEKQLKTIFQFFVRSFGTNNVINKPNCRFSIEALHVCYAKLSSFPQAVFSILKQPLLKKADQELYDNIKKLSSNLAIPVHLPKSTALTLHPRLKIFEKLATPLPRVCKLIQQIPNDPTLIQSIVTSYSPYVEWLALHLVSTVQDKPSLLPTIMKQLLESSQFSKIVIQAAIFESIKLITSPQFSTFEGAFARRRLSILGQLIGQLTLAVNRTISGQFLDLKHLLLYAFSQGKLFGVIPFVSNILCSASPIFNPPNPYTSSILQVLASIAMTDLLKLYIKNQIYQIFDHFQISIAQIKLLSLIPAVRQGNFDFISQPFALNYILSMTDIDKMIDFDDNVFSTLAAKNMVIPDPPNPALLGSPSMTLYHQQQQQLQQSKANSATTNEQSSEQIQQMNALREKMKNSLQMAALNFLKQEGKSLSKVASSTAESIILKDFLLSNNLELMQETAATLTKQLSAGLVVFTVFQKLQRSMSHQMLHDFHNTEHDWINLTIQANFNWIGQMLHDVVHLRALKSVQEQIDKSEKKKREQPRYIDSMSQSAQKNLPPMLAPFEGGLTVQQLQIYQDLAELPLSPAELSIPEINQDKSIKINTNFEEFFKRITSLVTTEINQNNTNFDPLADDSPFMIMMRQFPEINPIFEEFLSILKVMMKYMTKVTHQINDKIYGYLLQKVVSKVPKPFVTRAQPFVVGWLRNSIPSVSLLCDLINQGFITTTQLDRFFFDSLNKQPFNYRLFNFAIRFLHSTLFKMQIIKPHEMISSLTLVVSTPLSLLETNNNQSEACVNELKHVLDEMEVPLNFLSKLQTMATFDPNEEIGEVDSIIASFNKWKSIVEDENANDETILKATKETFELGRDFFIVVLYNEDIRSNEDIGRLFRCAKECGTLKSNWVFVASSFEYCIGGNAMVLKYDMKIYFDALIELINVIYDDIEFLKMLANLLHNLRPLLMPSFTLSWIQLITEHHFVYGLVKNNDRQGWPAMSILLADYIVSVAYTVDTNPSEVFDFIYKSLLRFILVLVHDFSDFIVAIVPEITSILQPQFTQVRNILLSAYPSDVTLVPISFAMKNLEKVPGIDNFVQIPIPQEHLKTELQFENAIKSESAFTELAQQLDKQASSGAIASFVIYVRNVLLSQSNPKQILSSLFLSNNVYFIITELIKKLNADATQVLINVIIDQLRFPSLATLFFYKTVLTLLQPDVKHQAPVQLDELIVTCIMQRAVTPAPHPWGLRLLIREMMTNEEIKLFERPFVQKSDEIKKFLNAIVDVFCKDDQ